MKKSIGIVCLSLAALFVMPCTVALSVSGSVAKENTSGIADRLTVSSGMQSRYGTVLVNYSDTNSIEDTDKQLNSESPGEAADSDSDTSASDMMIKVYFASEDTTRTMYLEDYIAGVVLGEMLVSFEKEALKAQAVAARSYTLYMIEQGGSSTHESGAVICTDYTHCQAYKSPADILTAYPEGLAEEYHSKLLSAVAETAGEVITYEGEIVKAYYFDNSGGFTESYENVWGGENHGYTQSVPCMGESDTANFCTLKYFTPEEFLELFKKSNENVDATADNVFSTIEIIERTSSNRIDEISVGGVVFKGTVMRSILGLKSTNVIFRELDDGRILTITFGSGHGVGMSQSGAQGMAQNGSTYEEILKYYYQDVELEKYEA